VIPANAVGEEPVIELLVIGTEVAAERLLIAPALSGDTIRSMR
jgi:hypothetical protein